MPASHPDLSPLSPTPPEPTPVAAAQPPARASWYRRLYARVEALSASRHATPAMMAISVVDGSFFPIPPFALLVPMVLARPQRWVRYALLGTVASIVGGLIGYWFGSLLASGAISFLHFDPNFRVDVEWIGVHGTIGELLARNFLILAALCSVLPTPLKVVAIGSGMVGVALPEFFFALCLGRAVRFFAIAGLMRFVGPPARRWLRV